MYICHCTVIYKKLKIRHDALYLMDNHVMAWLQIASDNVWIATSCLGVEAIRPLSSVMSCHVYADVCVN